MATPKVFVGYAQPSSGPTAHFHDCIVRLMFHDFGHSKMLFGGGHLSVISGPRIASARNQICKAFLEFPTKPDWLLMLDADMTFSADLVDQLIDTAEQHNLPILGGLCFGAGAGSVFPTLYRMVPSDEHPERSPVEVIYSYPKDSLVKVDATGAACLLIRRNVIEKMFEVHGQLQVGEAVVPNAAPWFAETIYHGHEIGEDWSFCLRAQMLGFPVHVHTGIQLGHQKTWVVDEAAFDGWMDEHKALGSGGQREKYLRATGALVTQAEKPGPTYVIIPVKGRYEYTKGIIEQLKRQRGYHGLLIFDNGSDSATRKYLERQAEREQIELVDAAGLSITEMWAKGVGMVVERTDRGQVAILNNDLRLGPDFLNRLTTALRADKNLWAVSGNYDSRSIPKGVQYVLSTAKSGGMAGFAYMLKIEPLAQGLIAFDTDLKTWYSDDDIAKQITTAGYKVGIVEQAYVEHLGGGSSTMHDVFGEVVNLDIPELRTDAERYREKWGLSWDTPEGW